MKRRPIPIEAMSGPSGHAFCVYRFRDHTGELLYVGATMDFRARLDAHCSKPWWKDVDHHQTTTRWFLTPAAAESAENAAIAAEHPKYNTRGTEGQTPSRYNPNMDAREARARTRGMTTEELRIAARLDDPVTTL